MNVKNLLIIFILFVINNSNSQPDVEFRILKEKFPDNEVVILNMKNSIDITLKNDDILIKYSTLEERVYLNDNAKLYDKGRIFFSGLFDLKKYEAFTLVPESKKYKKYNVESFLKKNMPEGNIFYDDSQELNYTFPRLVKGSKTVETKNYELIGAYYIPVLSISPYIPYNSVEFKLITDDNIDVDIIEMLQLDKSKSSYTEEKKSGRTTRIWNFDKTNTVKYETDAPTTLSFSPKMMTRIKSYDTKKGNQRVLTDLNDLHNWYCKTIAPSIESNDLFKNLADSICGNSNDTLEIAAKIFSWVQRNIKYIAIEDGEKGVVPEMATAVYYHRYGDCKGMSNLAFHLMKSKGLDARLCWVGTRDIPYKYSEFPTPNSDNHMISVLKHNNEVITLDATHSFLPFGMPSPFIQGKEALVNGKDCMSYELIEIPEIDAKINFTLDSCNIKIKGSKLIGKGQITFFGYAAMSMRERIASENNTERLKYLRNYLLKGTNKFQLDSFKILQFEDLNLPLVIHYDFIIPDYVIEINNEKYININLNKIHLSSKILENRDVPVEKLYNSSEINIVVLQIDDSLQVNSVPKELEFENNEIKFSNRYTINKNYLTRKQYYHHNSIVIETKMFKSWNSSIDEIQKNFNQQIVITKP